MQYKKSKYVIYVFDQDDKKIIYNTFNGGIIKLEETVYNILFSEDPFDDSIPYFLSLWNERIVVPFEMDEYSYLRNREYSAKTTTNKEELSYVIAPTMLCNLKCFYCFEQDNNMHGKMSEDTAKLIIDFITNEANKNKAIKKVSITWFGGEPLLEYETIKYICLTLIQRLQEINVSFSCRIITNGILLDEDKSHYLVEKCNLVHAQITLDGLKENYCSRKCATPQAYNRVLYNIKNIAMIVPSVVIRLNADKSNIKDMYVLADILFKELQLKGKIHLYLAHLKNYLRDKNSRCFTLNEYIEEKNYFEHYLLENGYIEKDNKTMTPSFKELHCSLACKDNYAIGVEGELYKCEHYFGDKSKIIGDVKNGLYYNPQYFKEIRGIDNSNCANCALYPVCRANCPEVNSLIDFTNGCSRYEDVLKRIADITRCYLANSN